MANTYNTFVVENEVQKILFEVELKGQLSDGRWENSRPHNHWKSWCDAEVVVGESPGRNFYPLKDNYNLVDRDLLEVVGHRMLFKVKAHLVLGLESKDLGWSFPDSIEDWDWMVQKAIMGNGRYMDKIGTLNDKGVTREKLEEVEAHPYSIKDLKKDLKSLKKAMRIKL